ncbi:uncharacterized protein LOC135340084 [Halichondria panicea]|uniref:uncharacterized protein LOC135340084 n=1 Tax=Halichondria panicea TaxID=6063 RepID=UPI00312B32C2
MMILGVITIVLQVVLVSSQVCPTWFIRQANKCECGQQIDTILQCSNVTYSIKILDDYCITYNNDTEHFGACPYNTKSHLSRSIKLPSDVSKLDKEMCGPLNRTGLLCSHCQPGLGPAAFSYYKECKECMPQPLGWLLFFVRLTVPLTLLCVIVIVFRINFVSPVLYSFVLIAQVLNTVLCRNDPFAISGYTPSYSFYKFVADFMGLFNLDFFLFLIPPFCISEHMSTLTVVALEYLEALYPITFTLAVYLFISLHDRGCKIIVICWRPFHKCLARFRRRWELKGSVVNAFATFFLLSYSKFCSISISLLKPIPLYDKYGNVTYTLFFAADFNVGTYIPLAILSSILTVTVVFLPAVFLLFYQNRFFQRCLFSCKIKCVLIHELANITQGYFKNGTTPGTRDCRWFAGVYLLLRIIFIAFGGQVYHLIVYQMIFIITPAIILGLRPYKKDRYNYFDAFFLILFAMGSAWYIYHEAFRNSPWLFVLIIAICLVLLYILMFISWMISSLTKWCGFSCCHQTRATHQTGSSTDEEALPHRISDPSEYALLLPSTT